MWVGEIDVFVCYYCALHVLSALMAVAVVATSYPADDHRIDWIAKKWGQAETVY